MIALAFAASRLDAMNDVRTGIPGLSTSARAVFIGARTLADEAGNIEDRRALERVLELSQDQVRFWLQHLEGRRWGRRALVKRKGARELWVLTADIPGLPGKTRAVVEDETDRPWKRKDAEWRKLRAQIGGVKRALEATLRERDSLKTELAETKKNHGLEADPQIVVLRLDLEHASRCLDVDCERCMAIETRLEVDRPQYETEVELVDKLTTADLVQRAGAALLRALRHQGVGARALAAEAGRALELAIVGEHREALRALDRLGRI